MMNKRNQDGLSFFNGHILTMNAHNETVQAVATEGGKILTTGSNEEVKASATEETTLIDLHGKTMLPGFIDAHTHIDGAAINLAYSLHVHTPPLKSIDEILEKIKKEAPKRARGEWIICQGSFQLEDKVIEKRYPTKWELDKVAPNHPVVIRASAHVYILNSKALEVAHITKNTPVPKGSGIEKDSNGEPTGILHEFIEHLSLPSCTTEGKREAIKQVAYEYYVKKGVTSVFDFPLSSDSISTYQELIAKNELPLRFQISILVPLVTGLDCLLSLGLKSGFGNDKIKLGGVKIFADGDADTAAVYIPGGPTGSYSGLLRYNQGELNEIVRKVHECGMQIMIHAVGDKAQDMALDAIETALKRKPRKDHRHRIEHFGDFFCTPERIKRAKSLGVIPVVTPAFPYDAGETYKSRIGPEGPQMFGALRSIINEGLMPPGSSDCVGAIPESTNPFFNIWCAVVKETASGNVLCPEERISVMDGIRMYTVNSAYCGFEENLKGSIEPGKLADLIVLSENPLKIPESEIKNIQVLKTIIGGKIVYEAL